MIKIALIFSVFQRLKLFFE